MGFQHNSTRLVVKNKKIKIKLFQNFCHLWGFCNKRISLIYKMTNRELTNTYPIVEFTYYRILVCKLDIFIFIIYF